MSSSITSTVFLKNPEIIPTFLEDTGIVLLRDYTQLDPFCSKYLINGVFGTVLECGLSVYGYDPKTDDYSKLVDKSEWCFIEFITPIADFDNSEGFVKAKDLRRISKLDCEIDSFWSKRRIYDFMIVHKGKYNA